MGKQAHWENIYRSKSCTEVSWFSPHLQTPLNLIQRVAPSPLTSIIDVGAAESTLVDDLLARGYSDITIMDISETALEHTRSRLGPASNQVKWLVADITRTELPPGAYDVWHDRAVFHFLTEPAQRKAYVDQIALSVRSGGHVIVGAFGPEGPTMCSGLNVVRFDAESLHRELGFRFRLIESSKELHSTPFGTTQQFVYCYCIVS